MDYIIEDLIVTRPGKPIIKNLLLQNNNKNNRSTGA